MAIRGLEQPTDDVVPFLLSAIRNIKYSDDKVTFADVRATLARARTHDRDGRNRQIHRLAR